MDKTAISAVMTGNYVIQNPNNKTKLVPAHKLAYGAA
jgi:hypothetical protein